MLDNLNKYDVVLASNSPRRFELLKGLNIPFRVYVINGLDEVYPEGLKGGDIPLYLSKLKASAYKSMLLDNTMVITADTIVWCDDFVLGKPKDMFVAKNMLQRLSGREHIVYTGVTIFTKVKTISFYSASSVRFAKLSEDEIDYYLINYNPLDKAGSYGVQDWIGYIGVEEIRGSYFNVMGLPIQRLYSVLKEF